MESEDLFILFIYLFIHFFLFLFFVFVFEMEPHRPFSGKPLNPSFHAVGGPFECG